MNRRKTQLLHAGRQLSGGGHKQCLSEEPSSGEMFCKGFALVLSPARADPHPTPRWGERVRSGVSGPMACTASPIPHHEVLEELFSFPFLGTKMTSSRNSQGPSRSSGQKEKRWDSHPSLCNSKGFALAKRYQLCFHLSFLSPFKGIVSVGGWVNPITLHRRGVQSLLPWHVGARSSGKLLEAARWPWSWRPGRWAEPRTKASSPHTNP